LPKGETVTMRVVWLAPYPFTDPSGVVLGHPAPWLAELAGGLAACGVELTIIALSRGVNETVFASENGVDLVFIPRTHAITRVGTAYATDRARLLDAVRQLEPDLVHGHGTEDAYSLAALESGYPAVITLQGLMGELVALRSLRRPYEMAYFNLGAILERRALARAEHVIAHNGYSAEYAVARAARARIHEIPNAVQGPFFKSGNRERVENRLLFVGSVTRAKGIEELLAAVALVRVSRPGVTLRVVGEANTAYVRRTVLPLLRRHGLEHVVELRGRLTREGVLKDMRSAQLLVHPTHADNAPTCVMEAMASGTPLVASAVGGIPFMVKDEWNGLLCGRRDVEGLAKAIGRALADDCLRGELARNGRLTAEQYRIGRVAERTLECYGEILAAGLRL
jgi:glycosyltransferase involved in cell wall biosynthesis